MYSNWNTNLTDLIHQKLTQLCKKWKVCQFCCLVFRVSPPLSPAPLLSTSTHENIHTFKERKWEKGRREKVKDQVKGKRWKLKEREKKKSDERKVECVCVDCGCGDDVRVGGGSRNRPQTPRQGEWTRAEKKEILLISMSLQHDPTTYYYVRIGKPCISSPDLIIGSDLNLNPNSSAQELFRRRERDDDKGEKKGFLFQNFNPPQ